MQKYRIYELARMFSKTNDEIISILRKNNIEVKGNLSSVDETAKALVEKAVAPKPKMRPKRPPIRTVRFDQHGRPEHRKEANPTSYSSYMPGGGASSAKSDAGARKTEAPTAKKEDALSQKEVRGTAASPREQSAQTIRQTGRSADKASAQTVRQERRSDRGTAQAGGANTSFRRGDGQGHQRDGQRRDSRDGRNGRPNRAGDRSARSQDARGGRTDGQRGGRPSNARLPKPAETEAPQPTQRREKPARKKTKKDWERSRREKESGSLMARSLRENKRRKKGTEKKVAEFPTEVEMPGSVTVKELADLFGREVSEIIKRLLGLGVMATINQNLDNDTVAILAEEFDVKLIEPEETTDPTEYVPEPDDPRFLKERPPVVTIMGHVDHGKTTLLDALRETSVALHEAGGITQSIGAYQIKYKGHKITFLDTPGHEAFTAMRSRGAQLTDIAVLIVAADDGVMPQTIEAIHHAKNAGVPIMVAINKIDKPGANPDRIKEELSHEGLISEEWGGDIIMTEISAKKKINLDELLENILLVAEVQELKANPNRLAYGIVVEAKLDKGRGPVMSVLVQNGTLHIGDAILAGKSWGKVRAMANENGRRMKSAEPSAPVEILGMDSVPEAGDHFFVMDEKKARAIASLRASRAKEEEQRSVQKVTLDNIFEKIKEGEMKDLNIIVKADVQGSVEALVQSFQQIKSDEVRLTIVHSAVGGISESDVMLASASNAFIIGFNVRPDANARGLAEKEGVDVRLYRVIYDAIDDVKAAMAGLLSPTIRENVIGHLEIRQVIHTPKVIVAGCYVQEGKITNTCQLRLIRDGIVVHEGPIASLRRFKDDVKEVAAGFECGVAIDNYRDVKEGDQLEAFELVEEAATLE